MPTITDILWGMALPSILGLLGGFLAGRRDLPQPGWKKVSPVLLLSLGFALSSMLLWGWKGWWAPSIFDRQWVIAAGLGLLAAMIAVLPRTWATVAMIIVPLIALLPLTLRTGHWWSGLAMGLGIAAAALITERSAHGRQPRLTLLLVMLWLSMLAPTLVMLAAAQQGQTVGILAAGLGGAWAASLVLGRAAPQIVSWSVTLALVLMAHQHVYGDQQNLAAFLCFAAAPLTLLVQTFIPERRRRLAIGLPFVLVIGLSLTGLLLEYFDPAAEPATVSDPRFDVTY